MEPSSESNSESESIDGEEEEKKMMQQEVNRKRSDKVFAKEHVHGEHCVLERRRCSLDELSVSSSCCSIRMDVYAHKHKDQRGKSAFQREPDDRPFKQEATLMTKKPIKQFAGKLSMIKDIGDKFKFSLEQFESKPQLKEGNANEVQRRVHMALFMKTKQLR